MITKNLSDILKNREFISLATCDFNGRPNVAPKFFLKLEGNYIFLVDYVFGNTFNNLKNNPRASLSIMDTDSLKGYQINGAVEIIEKGDFYDKIFAEVKRREISLAAERIIKGIKSAQRHKSFELAFPEKIAIFKVRIEEIVEIDSSGKLEREVFSKE